MIHFQCPHCGKPVKIDEAFAGKQAQCPGCKRVTDVPHATPIRRDTLDTEIEAALKGCDFALASKELADFFYLTDKDAASKGGRYEWKTEFVRGWQQFAANPCRETAVAWLKLAPVSKPMLVYYFTACSPGGILSGGRPEGIPFVGQNGFCPDWVKDRGRWVFQRTLASIAGDGPSLGELVAHRTPGADQVIVWLPRHDTDADERPTALHQLSQFKLRCYGNGCSLATTPAVSVVLDISARPERWRLQCPICFGRVGPDLEPVWFEPIIGRWATAGYPALENPYAGPEFKSVAPITNLIEWIANNQPSHLSLAYIGQQMWSDAKAMLNDLADYPPPEQSG